MRQIIFVRLIINIKKKKKKKKTRKDKESIGNNVTVEKSSKHAKI